MDIEPPIFCIDPNIMNESQCIKEINRLIKGMNKPSHTKIKDKRLDDCIERLKQICKE